MPLKSIKVENISKRYRLGIKDKVHDSLFGKFSSVIKSPFVNYKKLKKQINFTTYDSSSDTVWALKDISFDINQGEVLGIIGQNGAGKSTLLKVLAQITSPTTGRIEINGRVASLLEVGTGFHPDLTGRENVYLNGTYLGMKKKEIDNKFDEIIDFSGIEKFIDTPVKRYSSGMGVRLAFSVAAFLEPEILLIDEVLAVGDAQFQKKCLGKMENIAGEGRTVLFVSHRMSAVKSLCTRGILISSGRIEYDGEISETISKYIEIGSEKSLISKVFNFSNNKIRLNKIEISKDKIISGEGFGFDFYLEKQDGLYYDFGLTFLLTDEFGNLVFVGSSYKSDITLNITKGNLKLHCQIPKELMNEGYYSISRLLFVKDRGTVLLDVKDCFSFRIHPKVREIGWMGEKEQGIIDPKLEWEFEVT